MERKNSFKDQKSMRTDEYEYKHGFSSGARISRPSHDSYRNYPKKTSPNDAGSFSSYVPEKYKKRSDEHERERDQQRERKPLRHSDFESIERSGRFQRSSSKQDTHKPMPYNFKNDGKARLLVNSRIRVGLLKQLFNIVPGLTSFKSSPSQKKNEFILEYANEFLTAFAFSKFNHLLLDGLGRIDIEYLPKSIEKRFQSSENAQLGEEIVKDMISTHPELYSTNSVDRSRYPGNRVNDRSRYFNGGLVNRSMNNQPSSQIYVDQNQNQPIAIEPLYDSKHVEYQLSNKIANFKSKYKLTDNKSTESVAIEMKSRDEIDESLFNSIMSQFENLVEAKLDEDKKSSRAVFSNDFAALLAVNSLNGTQIAHTVFTARLAADPSPLIGKTAGADLPKCMTSRPADDVNVVELSDSEMYFKDANYDYNDDDFYEDEQEKEVESNADEDEGDSEEYETISSKEDTNDDGNDVSAADTADVDADANEKKENENKDKEYEKISSEEENTREETTTKTTTNETPNKNEPTLNLHRRISLKNNQATGKNRHENATNREKLIDPKKKDDNEDDVSVTKKPKINE